MEIPELFEKAKSFAHECRVKGCTKEAFLLMLVNEIDLCINSRVLDITIRIEAAKTLKVIAEEILQKY